MLTGWWLTRELDLGNLISDEITLEHFAAYLRFGREYLDRFIYYFRAATTQRRLLVFAQKIHFRELAEDLYDTMAQRGLDFERRRIIDILCPGVSL